MKLEVNFNALVVCVKKMGCNEFVPFQLEHPRNLSLPEFDIGLETSAGLEVKLEEIELVNGVFTFNGKQVLLFIPDHSYKGVETVKSDPSQGNKYHLTYCEALRNMRLKNRFNRYFATTNRDGYFKIYDNLKNESEVPLYVCKYCLAELNYRNYLNNRAFVFQNFNLEEFFNYYLAILDNLPKDIGQNKAGYADNWAEISRNLRASKYWCCEDCGVNLSNHRHLLDVHHKNGVKQDNSPQNLKVVCRECHKKQDSHEHLTISIGDLTILADLRRQQGLMSYTRY